MRKCHTPNPNELCQFTHDRIHAAAIFMLKLLGLALDTPDCQATRWLSWYGVGLASADRLLVHSGVSSAPAERQRAPDQKKIRHSWLSVRRDMHPTSPIAPAQAGTVFSSNARWLSPGRLSSRKDSALCELTELMQWQHWS